MLYLFLYPLYVRTLSLLGFETEGIRKRAMSDKERQTDTWRFREGC